MRSYFDEFLRLRRLTRFCSIKMVHPMRVDISESSSNLRKSFLLLHQNVRQMMFDTPTRRGSN